MVEDNSWNGYVDDVVDVNPEEMTGPLTLKRMFGPTLLEFKRIGVESARVVAAQSRWIAKHTGKMSRVVVDNTKVLVDEFKKGYNK